MKCFRPQNGEIDWFVYLAVSAALKFWNNTVDNFEFKNKQYVIGYNIYKANFLKLCWKLNINTFIFMNILKLN